MSQTEVSPPEIGKSLEAGGVSTNYHDHGAGPPVLLIHGSGPGVSAWANWSRNIPVLAKDFRVVAPDLAGFGYSDAIAGGVRDKAVWVRQLVGVLDALKLDKVSVVGNSFGGGMAIALMVAHPDRVERAVLMGSVGLKAPISESLDYLWGYQPSLENMRKAIERLVYDQSRITEELVQMRHQASSRPESYAPYAATFGQAPRQNAMNMLASDEAQIAAITQEVLILHGAFDRVIPLETSVRLNQLIRNSDLHSFAGAGHWVQIERAASFNRMVAQFIKHGLNE
ncbi:alpha/beta fold hydrolase [Phenylobacterium sp.]|uniref:alpha/beta fold hydrolase n=1 Tax=Phenylobacterium sp. TaxID=1871053 RepID=UPI0027365663|nr:alpha/beta hydrolase [Phenylobacterium sp.]MDP3659227.1 alpha/beta hydrolase [Phenylobacterium sp.]